METEYQTQPPTIQLSHQSLQLLKETRKWTHFLAIMGFIFIAIMVIIAFAASSFLAAMVQDNEAFPFSSSLFGFIYLIIAFIYFFPVLYLYRFSTFTEKALNNYNSNDLNEAFKNLKSHYKFMGIVTIIILASYALMFLIGIAVALLALI